VGLPVRRCALAGYGAFPDPSWNLPKGLVADWPAPRLSSATLRVRLALDGDRSSEWHPGLPNPDQLPGTVRTLDKVDGATELRCDRLPVDQRSGRENDAHCAMGVISRSGWALLDDSLSARFDGAAAQWDWVAAREPERLEAERAARAADGDPRCEQWARGGECEANRAFMQGACRAACGRAEARAAAVASEASGEALLRLDWYLFAAGLDYASALRDFAALSGPQPIPPRYAFGVWFSRWWPWADWEAAGLLREFEARGVPADVLVTDMDWHHTCYRRTYGNESEKSMDGLPLLNVLSLVASSSLASLSSASFCAGAAACRSLVLAASFAFRRNSVLLAAYPGPSSLSSSPRARTTFLTELTPTPIICLQVMLLLRSTLSSNTRASTDDAGAGVASPVPRLERC